MTATTDALQTIRKVRQTRQFTPDPVDPDTLREILEVARWSGSAANTQPWHFVVVDDPDELRQLSEVRPEIGWVSTAPVAIANVLKGNRKISEAYDEGRVTERIMIAANLLGLGSAVAWYGDASQQARAKEILGAPEDATTRALVVIGHPAAGKQPTGVEGGRKPLEEIVSYGRVGEKR